jgi:hypothetical protein
MAKQKHPSPRKIQLPPLTASKLDTLADDSPTPMFTVYDPEYAFQVIGHIGAVLSSYKPADNTEFVGETMQGIGFFLENLAKAGEKSVIRGEGRKV